MADPENDPIGVMRDALMKFHERTAAFINSYESGPANASQATTEASTFSRPESISTAMGVASHLIELAAEHLTAFVKTATPPFETIACWTCVRSMLESCALCAWILDPAIDAMARAGRGFAIRYQGIKHQSKYFASVGANQTELDSHESRIDTIERDALALGFSPVTKTIGQRTVRDGVAVRIPGATEMIKLMLNEEPAYRLLSAVAHGQNWAIRRLAFKDVGNFNVGSRQLVGFKKHVDPQRYLYLGSLVMRALSRSLWNMCRYYGWNELQLEEIFEDTADRLQIDESLRFWRTP